MKNLSRLLIALVIVSIFSCSKDNETPAVLPTTAFSQDRMIIETDEDITFNNSSSNAVSYSWSFGDNTTSSTDENPVHTYTRTGDFTVTLTATSETGDEALSTSTVTVGNRFTIGLGIEIIPFVDGDGNAWDPDGSGPELLFGFAVSTAQSFTPFIIGNDMVTGDFPTGGTIPANLQIMLTNEDWAFAFIDDEDPFDSTVTQFMASFVLNPVTITSIKNYQDGTGTFEFESNGYSFLIAFEVRN